MPFASLRFLMKFTLCFFCRLYSSSEILGSLAVGARVLEPGALIARHRNVINVEPCAKSEAALSDSHSWLANESVIQSVNQL